MELGLLRDEKSRAGRADLNLVILGLIALVLSMKQKALSTASEVSTPFKFQFLDTNLRRMYPQQ